MGRHSENVIEMIDVIKTTVKLLGYPVEFNYGEDNRFFVFSKSGIQWMISYNESRLIVTINGKQTEISNSGGVNKQLNHLQEVMECL